MELKQAFWILRHGSGEGLREYLKAVKTIEDSCVPVVRCKDCRYWGDEAGVTVRTDGVRFARCKVHNLCVRGKKIGWCPTENDFCSYGEKRRDKDGTT